MIDIILLFPIFIKYKFNIIYEYIKNNPDDRNIILRRYYKYFTSRQRILIMKGCCAKDAYAFLLYQKNLTEYEYMILVNRLLYGKKEKWDLENWRYIKILMEQRVPFDPYVISKFTDYLIKNEVLEYIPRFYEIIITNRNPNYCNNELWINYDCPRIEPYVLIAKLI
jgi:hypothetical protein